MAKMREDSDQWPITDWKTGRGEVEAALGGPRDGWLVRDAIPRGEGAVPPGGYLTGRW